MLLDEFSNRAVRLIPILPFQDQPGAVDQFLMYLTLMSDRPFKTEPDIETPKETPKRIYVNSFHGWLNERFEAASHGVRAVELMLWVADPNCPDTLVIVDPDKLLVRFSQ